MSERHLLERHGDALLVVDVQRDFMPGGALGVQGGDAVIGPLNARLAQCAQHGTPVFATRDWHPPDHCSFAAQGGPWPAHCIAGTLGARFDDALRLPPDAVVIDKATDRTREAYSAFAGTVLEQRLRAAGVRRLVIGGLATDYCVLQTTLDARERGFEVVVLGDAIAAVNVKPDDGRNALDTIRRAGAIVT